MTETMLDVLVVTPWYPTSDNPYAGSFVRASVKGLARHRRVAVVHLENVPQERVRSAETQVVDGIPVLWVPVAVEPLTPRGEMARRQEDALRRELPEQWAAAPVLHAHVGIPSGWAAAAVARPGQRMILTEHSSTLGKVLRDPDARRRYASAVHRSETVLAVSEFVARSLRAAFPEMAERVHVLPNPVDMDASIPRARDEGQLDRWIYVGNLVAVKGVERLIRALAHRRDTMEGRHTTLTVVGDGPLREGLQELAKTLGVAEAVELVGAVPPERVPHYLATADVLLHLSSFETFGIGVLEALAAGLPVIATRCGGPQETLAEAVVLGRARLVPVDDDVETVVMAVRDLEAGLPGSDPATARAVLVRRYHPDAVTSRLLAILDGEVPAHRDPAALRVLAIAISPPAARAVQAMIGGVVESGGSGIVITLHPSRFGGLGPAVRVVDVSPIEIRFWLYAGERIIVARAPARLLSVTRRLLGGTARRAPGPMRAPARTLTARVDRLRRDHASWARHRRPRIYAKAYDQVAPWWLARVVDRTTLADLDLDGIDVVVTPDWRATPMAWRIVKRSPDVEVRRPMNRNQVARAFVRRINGA